MSLTHLDENGKARMVDISEKTVTSREAIASGKIRMNERTLAMITEGTVPKGDVFAAARIAGIMAAKRTSELIPLCHQIPLDSVKIEFIPDVENKCVFVEAIVRCSWKTGVEMEALTAVSVAGLTIYDMCKAVDKEMEICEISLLKKTGGKSGEYIKKGI
jgi:cyclic pyranopterin monophosphate synthase